MVFSVIFVAAVSFVVWRYFDVRNVSFIAADGKFQIYKNGKWQDFLIKGVNLGLGKPNHFPGEVQVTKEEYYRWFEQIAEMNANTIRVYTIQSPEFYETLFRFNFYEKNPIYLFHGTWIDEELVAEHQNAYAPELMADYQGELKKLIDVVHGKATIENRRGHASGRYVWDVSPYVAGYILGTELDAYFVTSTNENNAHINGFDGNYLYTENASPHEAWLAQCGDFVISYEAENYGTQKPVSWVNWLTTDPMWHTNEPDKQKEDFVSVDTEHILPKDTYTAGLFASYHVYPYYPEFMIFQPEYLEYRDENGKQNPYKAYLLDLHAHHSVPLLVAEFGLPSSRGNTHINPITGYNQGNLTENEQGYYSADLFDSIVSSGCAGGMLFTWQNEWFKRSWNTMDFDIPEQRAYWPNYQVSEQNYGLMSFDTGKSKTICYTDGDVSEWDKVSPMFQADGAELSVISDEGFVYFLIKDINGVQSKKYVIGIDSLSSQGNTHFNDMGINFGREMENVIIIDGEENSSIKVDSYHDVFYRQYSLLGVVEKKPEYEQKNTGIFNPINLLLSNRLILPLTGEEIAPRYYETGKLTHANSNPESPDFNSIADFYINRENNAIEIRIPWQLLGAADPSQKKMIGDLYKLDYFDINPTQIEGFYAELYSIETGKSSCRGNGYYSWAAWGEASYHERLKQSYYIMRDKFSEY